MKGLDFSEKACIRRYVTYPYHDEDCEDIIYIEGIACDDTIIYTLSIFGRIVPELDICETGIAVEYEEVS